MSLRPTLAVVLPLQLLLVAGLGDERPGARSAVATVPLALFALVALEWVAFLLLGIGAGVVVLPLALLLFITLGAKAGRQGRGSGLLAMALGALVAIGWGSVGVVSASEMISSRVGSDELLQLSVLAGYCALGVSPCVLGTMSWRAATAQPG